MDDRTGQQFCNYRLLRLLGEGGSAKVYLGKHLQLHSQAAIKVLRTKLVTRERSTFVNEARTIAKLDHPSIIRVLDSGFEQGQPYFVMAYAPGGSLRQLHPAGSRLSVGQVLSYVRQIAVALQYAHDHQIVHRNIKPQNMLLGRDGRVLLSDFGIVVTSPASITQGPPMAAGSVAYLAPEQIMGKSQPASDQYALAVVIYEWLTGEQLFQGTFSDLCAQHLYAPPPPLQEKNPTVSSAVEDVIIKALAKEPAQRFDSIQQFAEALVQSVPEDLSTVPLPPESIQAADEDDSTLSEGMSPDSSTQSVSHELSTTDTVAEYDTINLTPSASTQEIDEDLLADTGKRATAVALLSSSDSEQEQLTTPTEDDEDTQPRVPRVVIDTSTFRYPASPAEQSTKPGGMSLWQPSSWLKQRKMLIIVALLLLLLLSGVAYALPRIGGSGSGQTATPTSLPLSATVAITPQQKAWSKTYMLSAVTGTPHSAQHQVQARLLSVTTAAQSQTVNATGVRDVPGTGVAATGILTFYNAAPTPLTLNQGTVLTNSLPNTGGGGPLQMVLDAPLVVPAAAPGRPRVQASVPAHVVQIGAAGNIAAGRFLATGKAGASPMPTWSATNPTAFSGGVDKRTETYVKQSDIDTAAKTLLQSSMPEPQQVLKSQMHATERLVGSGGCTPNQQANHQANDKAATVVVSVWFTCVGNVYDHDKAITLTSNLLRQDMTTAHYTVMKNIVVTIKQQTVVDDQGKIALRIQAQANGIYHFDDAALQMLTRGIAGKGVVQARNWLSQQEGVSKATITLTGGTGKNILPASTQDITINVAS